MDVAGLAALIALPLTAVGAIWPIVRDRSRLAKLERVAQLVELASLSQSERLRLAAYRRRLTRQVFVRTMLRRRWFDLIAGLYGVIAGPVLLVTAIVTLVGGTRGGEAWEAIGMSVITTAFGWLVLGLRGYRVRQQARRLLAIYRSPVSFVGTRSLGRLVARGSGLEPGGEGVE